MAKWRLGKLGANGGDYPTVRTQPGVLPNQRAFKAGFALVLLLLISLSGCGTVITSSQNNGTPFVPPTPAAYQPPTPTPQPTPPSGPVQAAPVTSCSDQLTFLSDVTIPDGTEVEAESTLDKRWEVENSGNCNWDENYRVRLIAGPDMGAQTEQALYPARTGTRAVIRIVFKAPTEPGSYRSAWQAVSPKGDPFGDPFFIVITVK